MSDDQDPFKQLLDYEQRVTGLLAQLTHDHVAIQQLDYDRDLTLLRPILDTWLHWHLDASYWLSRAKQLVRDARRDHRAAWQQAVQSGVGMGRLRYDGSYEERRVIYEIASDEEHRKLDVLEGVVETVTDFKFALRTALDHWNARRADVKFESAQEAKIPGADYST